MKHYLKSHHLHIGILICLSLGLLLGCSNTHDLSTIHGTTQGSSPISATASTISDIKGMLVPITIVKYADYLSDCDTPVDAISPDAVWAFDLCAHDGVSGVYVWKIGEQQATRLFNADEIKGAYPYFSPDGTKLLVKLSGGLLWLYEVGRWETPKMMFSQFLWNSTPFWSPDSQSIAIKDLSREWALSIMKLDGTYKHILAYEEIHTDWEWSWYMFGDGSWSPDSSRIAYVIVDNLEDPTPIQLWTIEVPTGNKELLYSGKPGEIGYLPNWSPDGEHIMLIGSGLENPRYMAIYNIKNNKFNSLSTFNYDSRTMWSPDGKYLSIEDKKGIYIYSIATGESKYIDFFYGALLWKDEKSIIIQQFDNNFYVISWQ